MYVGDDACAPCHKDKYKSYDRTSHHLTSRPPSADSISASFAPGANTLKTSNPGLFFRMTGKGGRFYETAIWGMAPSIVTETEQIDVVIGSGRKGQSYLFWKGDQLFQLPVSYWVDIHQWVNSPGYNDGDANFDRPIAPRCLECHASYVDSLTQSQFNRRYRKGSLVLGISCERCHGPGREHVSRHQSGRAESLPEVIVNPAKLSRERNIDVCAQCHDGMRFPIAPPFSYISGKALDEYLDRDRSDANSPVDVHGGTVRLFERSRCFQSSANFTCTTCHDVHFPQRDTNAFSSRCLACHKVQDCGISKKLGTEIANSCVDCHMPVQMSKAISSDSNGKQIRAIVRNHWITIYPEAASSK